MKTLARKSLYEFLHFQKNWNEEDTISFINDYFKTKNPKDVWVDEKFKNYKYNYELQDDIEEWFDNVIYYMWMSFYADGLKICKCICTLVCDCQRYEDGYTSNNCPEHNSIPEPHPDCEASVHRNGAIKHGFIVC